MNDRFSQPFGNVGSIVVCVDVLIMIGNIDPGISPDDEEHDTDHESTPHALCQEWCEEINIHQYASLLS